MPNDQKNQTEQESDFIRESAKKYEKVINEIDENAEKFFQHVKNTEADPFSEDVLVQKIIANTVSMFASEKMQEVIKSLEGKLDPLVLKDLINMIAFSTSAAVSR